MIARSLNLEAHQKRHQGLTATAAGFGGRWRIKSSSMSLRNTGTEISASALFSSTP
jgi:hypothetical protein